MQQIPGIILNNNQYDSKNATYIIFGNPRGGTTMVANLLIKFGIFLGENLQNNLEDNNFNLDYIKKNSNLNEEQIINKINETVHLRNKQYDVWGWKYPRVINYFEKIKADIINPKFICILRDPFAVSKRRIFRKKQNPYNALKETTNFSLRNIKFLQKNQNPTIFCSYENIIKNPLEFTHIVNNFVGNPYENLEKLKEISKAINPDTGYGT